MGFMDGLATICKELKTLSASIFKGKPKSRPETPLDIPVAESPANQFGITSSLLSKSVVIITEPEMPVPARPESPEYEKLLDTLKAFIEHYPKTSSSETLRSYMSDPTKHCNDIACWMRKRAIPSLQRRREYLHHEDNIALNLLIELEKLAALAPWQIYKK